MKSLPRLSLVLVLALALLASCKKKVPDHIKHIPKEASFVAIVNAKSIQNKLVKSQMTIENLLKSFTSPHDSAMDKGKREWEDLKNSGIDLDENVYVSFVQKSGNAAAGQGTSVGSVSASLKDAAKLETYIKKKQPGAQIQKEKDYSYVQQNDNIVAWANDLVIAMTYNQNFKPQMEYDSTGQFKLSKPGNVNIASELKTEVGSYFAMKEDASVASLPEFRDLMQDKSDVNFWVNSASTFENFPIPLARVKELTENSYTAASLNFGDGKIEVNSKSYYSKPLGDLLKKYSGATADLDLVQHYPSSNINAFAVFSFNPELITGLVNYLEVGGVVDNWLSRNMGGTFTLNDLVKSLKGDLAIIVSDFNMQTKNSDSFIPGMSAAGLPPVKFLVNIPVGDKTKLNLFLDNMVKQNLLVKQNTAYTLNPAMRSTGIQLAIDDKNIVLGTDSAVLVQYKSKTARAVIDEKVFSDFKGKGSVGYVDLQKIMNAFPVNDQNFDTVLNTAKLTFKDARGYAENFNGKSIESHFELRMTNEKDNSLISLLRFFAVAGETARKHAAVSRRYDDMGADSLTIPDLEKVSPSEPDTR